MALTEATGGMGFPILSVLIFLPVAFLVALRFVGDERRASRIALAGALLELALACLLVVAFVSNADEIQFAERLGPLPLVGVSYQLGVDGISLLFVPLTALLTVLVVVYAEYSVAADAKRYLMATLGLEATLMGAFVSLDLVLFWLFFVLELVPSWYLITRFGTGPRRHRAAREYIGFMLTGSALMLVAIVLLAINVAGERGGGLSFDYLDLLSVEVSSELQTVVFFLLFFGFAVKSPIFPFHTWLPKVLEHGPIVGMGVFLVGVKLGTYGFLRFVIPLVPEAAREWSWLMAALGATGIVYGALIALVQTNLRRLLAFASLSHMGVVMLGLFSLNFAGFQGGLLQMLNLGVAGAGLFFVAGFLHTRVGPPELSSMGGLVYSLPLLSTTFLIIALATVGLPGTGGFNGEHLVLIGAYEVGWVMALAVGSGTVLTAAYLLWYFQRAFMGPDPGPGHEPAPAPAGSARRGLPDLRPRELLIAVALGAIIFWIGLASGPFLRDMNGSLRWLEQRIDATPEQLAPTRTGNAASLRGAS
jgi:NADH-quinone oxidoreductase subunit M